MTPDTLITVPPELFALAESSSFQGSCAITELDAGYDTYHFRTPPTWRAIITNTGNALLVSGTVTASATTACARCLEDVFFDFNGELEGYYLINTQEEPPEDMDDDEFEYLPENKTIDMEPLIIAGLLLELPLVPLCDEECKGICPECGANKNTEPCTCEEQKRAAEEAEALASNPFAVLKDMDLS